ASGQYPPITCSLRASPEPSPSQVRPGYVASNVAAACATSAGCCRNDGHVTPGPRSPVVCSANDASTLHTNGDCPCAGTHGWKWSAAICPENPCRSASSAISMASLGENCSSAAAIPICTSPTCVVLSCRTSGADPVST